MGKPRLLLTEPVIDEVSDYLSTFCDLTIGKRGYFNDEQHLIDHISDYDYLLCMLTSPVTKRVIEAGKKLKVIANYAVGFNNIDVKAAHVRNILICNTPDVLTEATSDLTFALILSTTRNILKADKETREGYFDGWHPKTYLGLDFRNKNLGILGLGRIGYAVAKRALSFGFNIHYFNRNPIQDEAIINEIKPAYHDSLKSLLEVSDVLSIHSPLNKESHHLINAKSIAWMKDGAYIINTGRGAVINENDLAHALMTGKIAGAGLDVFEFEPQIDEQLLKAPNTVLVPHIGSATLESRKAIGMFAADAIKLHVDGKLSELSALTVKEY